MANLNAIKEGAWKFSDEGENAASVLNDKVLKPWGELRIEHRWGQGQANVIALAIPKEALPADVAPGREGLEVHALPGLTRGVDFIHKHYPEVHMRWQAIERLWRQYEELRARRRALIEPWVSDQMKREFPKLGPARLNENEKDTYVLGNILAVTEMKGWDAAARGEVAYVVPVSRTETHSGDTVYHELHAHREYGTLVHTYTRDLADADAMERVIKFCLRRPEVARANEEFVACFRDLEKAIETFRTELREVSVAVEVAGS